MNQLFALLVGINRYLSSSVPGLNAPGNDVAALATLLWSQYGVPETNICRLLDAQATRKGIHTAFCEHLIAGSQAGDAVLFYYSGHGSQAPTVDPTVEPDRLDETIVPHDSRTAGIYDIRDKELGAWVAELGRRGVTNVTVILDKCHAGSGWRAADPGEAIPHTVPKDDRKPQPPLRGLDGTPLSNPTLWQPHPEHVFIAACLDIEKSYECYFASSPDGQAGAWFSVLTYYLLRALREPGPAPSYTALFNRIVSQVTARMSGQHPQIEGRSERQLFDKVVLPCQPALVVTRVLGDQLTLSGGILHGLSTGILLNLYSPDRPDAPIGTAVARHISIDEATAQLQAGADTTRLAVGVKARVVGGDYGVRRRSVAVEGRGELAEAIRQALSGEQPYLSLVVPEIGSEFRVVANGQQVRICGANRDDVLVPVVSGPDSPQEVRRCLWHMVRYRNALQMENPASALNSRVTLRLRDKRGPLSADAGGGYQLRSGDEIWMEVENQSQRSLYLTLLDFNPCYGITRLYPYPRQMHETFLPHLPPFMIGWGNIAKPLPIWLPKGRQQGDDYLKLFVTTTPVNYLDVLEQNDLEQAPRSPKSVGFRTTGALARLVTEVVTGKPPKVGIRAVDDWTALQVRCTVTALR